MSVALPPLAAGAAALGVDGGQASQRAQAYRRLTGWRLLVLALLAAAIVAALLFDFTTGPSGLALPQLLQTLHTPDAAPPALRVIVWDIRLPYALMAVAVGLALGLAGAEMQTVLANPLASPFTLGLSSAAAFGAALAIVLDWHLPGVPASWAVPANAFVFAMASALLLDGVARWGGMSATGVVLFGIALVFSFNALVSLLQFVATAEALQGLVFWTMGSLSRATWPKLGALALALAVVLPLSMRNAWRLTALRLGEDRAASFGVDVRRLRLGALLRISLLAALSVAFVGSIGFIGLVAPHIARRLVGDDHRFYLPASALVGALVLSLASVASKALVPGVIVPVGIVTSLVGIPFFLAIVLRTRGAGMSGGGLQISGLQVAYGKRVVIPALSVADLQPGTVTVVLGPNGSGKSTLLRALAGLTRASGQVCLHGQALDKASLAERARRVVYQPQALPAAVHLRVIESLMAARKASPHALHATAEAPQDAVLQCAALLQQLGIDHLAMRHLDELSGGQVQLAGLAQALIRQPQVLMLDEPLSALDLNHQFHVMALVGEQTRRCGMVTLVVLHDLGLALRHADRVLVLQNGELQADGPPRDAINPQLLARVYGVQARVEPCSRGFPQVVVDGLLP